MIQSIASSESFLRVEGHFGRKVFQQDRHKADEAERDPSYPSPAHVLPNQGLAKDRNRHDEFAGIFVTAVALAALVIWWT